MKTDFQDRLNELLDSDPRSFTAIGKELGVSKQAVSAWRSGVRSPKKSMIIKIAKMYNVSIEWLMGFDVNKNRDSKQKYFDDDSQLLKKLFHNMSSEDQTTVWAILERTELAMKERGEL